MIIGIISLLLFGLVDTFFIGQLGTDQLAALGFTFPISFIVMNIIMGFTIGLAAVLSKTLGEGDQNKATRLTTDTLLLSIIIIALIVAIGIASIEPLFTLIGANEVVMPYIKEYMLLWYIGAIFLVTPMIGNAALRATGDMKTPAIMMFISAIMNALLDPLFIFGLGPIPALGMQGAALATLISWGISCVIAIWLLTMKVKLISFTLPTMSELLASWKPVLYIAIPAGITNLLIPLSTTILTAIIAIHGVEAVAAFGVGTRIEALAMVVIMSLSVAILPFIGQNLGAKKNARVREAISIALKFCFWFQMFIYLLLLMSASLLAELFTDDLLVAELIVLFLFIVPASYSFQGMMMISGSVMNGINRPVQVMVLSIIRLFILFIPFAYAGSQIADIKGLFIGLLVASIIASVMTHLWLKRTLVEVLPA